MKWLKLTPIIPVLIFLLVDFSDAANNAKDKGPAESTESDEEIRQYNLRPVGKFILEKGEKKKPTGDISNQPPVGKVHVESGEEDKPTGEITNQPPVGKVHVESGEEVKPSGDILNRPPVGKFYMETEKNPPNSPSDNTKN